MASLMVTRLPLAGRATGRAALVDAADFAQLCQYKWYLHQKGYAYRKGPSGNIYLHRMILGLERGDPRQGEHINRNPLDCRRGNLRIACGSRDNQQNLSLYRTSTTGYRGVTRRGRRFIAQVMLNRRMHYLGIYDTAEDAGAVAAAFRAEHMPFSEDATP